MKNTLIIGLFFIFATIELFTNSIVQYEYWFDDSFDYRTTQQIANQEEFILLENIELSSLSVGLHRFNIRFQDSLGLWSAIRSSFFIYKGNYSGENNIIGYEYWLDDDFAERTFTEIESTQEFILIENLDFSAQTVGLHRFNIRFQDSNGFWNAIKSSFFIFKGSNSGENNVVAYQYWFDDDYENKVFAEITSSDEFILVDKFVVDNLKFGLHRINIRFQDSNGFWSMLKSSFFIKRDFLSDENKITRFRYWFDDNLNNKQIKEFATPTQLTEIVRDIQLPAFPDSTNHTIHIQYEDASGLWSSSYSSEFFFTLYQLIVPVLMLPQNEAIDVVLEPTLIWEKNEFASFYHFQVSTNEEFSELIVNEENLENASYILTELDNGTQYFWRVSLTDGTIISPWSEVWSFTTVAAPQIIDINLSSGWNTISSNIIPNPANLENIFAEMEELVIVKNADGQIFEPAQNINQIGDWNVAHGYMVYVTAPATLQIIGTAVNPTETEINLVSGWNLVSYLRNSPLAISTALEGINNSLILVKNNLGQLYYPAYGLNTIGNMQQGQGYWIYMNSNAVLVYPGN